MNNSRGASHKSGAAAMVSRAPGAKRKRPYVPGLESLEERITPFKPYTHLAVANEAYADAVDDGKVTVQQRIVDDSGQVSIVNHEYAVNAELLSALQNHHDYFQAGVIAGDGFPELLMGQSVLHPANVGAWAQHILDQAWSWSGSDRPQVLAWAYGFMSHIAGDMWAHTLVNEFSGGAFPDAADVVTETEAKSNALKHIIVEGYIGDATPGYDGNPTRTELFGPFVRKDANDADPTREFSDDSTPGFEFAAPREFIYQTLVQAGVGPVGDRGPLIGLFTTLRDQLRAVANYTPGAILSERIDALENAQADRDGLDAAIDAWNACSGLECGDELANLIAEAVKFGFESLAEILEAGFDVLLGLAEEAVNTAAAAVFGFYFNAWADDIDAGLQHWSELGLGLSNALFNAQSKRDTQNGFGGVNNEWKFDNEQDGDRIAGEYGIGTFDVIFYELDQDFTDSAHGGKSFVENHLMPMLGFPDFLSDIKDVGGEIFNDVQNFLDGLTAPLTGAFDFLNPLDDAITDFKAAAKDAIGDLLNDAFHAVLGVNVEQLMSVLSNASKHLDDATLDIGVQIPLFGPDDHEKLDAYLGITDPDHHTPKPNFIQDGHEIPGGILKDDVTFERNVFAAYGNAVTLTKLAFLDGAGMDQMISDFLGWSSQGNSYRLYSAVPNANVLTVGLPQYDPSDSGKDDPFDPVAADNFWLNSIDGSHQWRADANPVFNGSGGTPELHSGNGNFPLWESCLLRDGVFRSLFVDWQDDFRDDGIINQSANFPDHGDLPSHDRNEITPSAVLNPVGGVLTVAGTDIDDTITLRREFDGGIEYLIVEWDEVRNGDVIYGCGESVKIPLAGIVSISSSFGAGNDALTLDNSGGLLAFTITHDGGAGVNVLVIAGDPGLTIARETYLAGQSTIVIDPDGNMGVGATGSANGDEEIITFTSVARIDDAKPVTQLDVFGLSGDDDFALTAGDTIDGAATARITNTNGGFTTIQVANKTTATVSGLDGADTFTVDLATAARNLATLKLYGNELSDGGLESDDSAGETFNLRATPAGVGAEAHGQAGNDTFNVGSVGHSLDSIHGTLMVSGGANAATPTASLTSGSTTNTLPVGDQVNFNDHGDATTGHTYQLDADSFTRTGLDNPISHSAVETLNLNTGTGAATVNVVTTPANSNTTVTTQDNADAVTIATTGAASNLRVVTAGGADEINLRGAGSDSIVVAQSGADNDVFNVGSSINSLGEIRGRLTLDGGANAATPTTSFVCGPETNTQPVGDQVNFNDHGDASAGLVYQLDAGEFQRTGLQPLSYSGIETLNVNTGTAAATVTIDNTPENSNGFVITQGADDIVTVATTGAASNLRVSTAGGSDQITLQGSGAGSIVDLQSGADDDSIELASSAGLDNIGGTICIDAGAGNANHLLVSDFSGDANPSCVVTSSTITGFAGANEDRHIEYRATGGAFNARVIFEDPITHLGVILPGIEIWGATAGPDHFAILSTLAGSATNINGFGGSDVFNVGSAANSLDDIRGMLKLTGGGHGATPTTTFTCGPDSNTQPMGDQINFNDQGDSTAGHVYRLTASSFERTGLDNPITFFNVETLTVNAGTSAATIAIDTTPANSNAFVVTQDGADNVTVTTTGAESNLRLTTAGGADQINLRGSGAGSIVDMQTGAEDDVIRVSSNAGVSDDGNLNGIGGAVCIDAGAGAANRLIVSDFSGDANPDVVITASTITGFAGADEDQHIEFHATGGGFINPLGDDGIFLSGANLGADQFTILAVLAENTLTVWTNGDADRINVGSKLADDDGNLDLIAGLLTLGAGVGADEIYVNDRAKAGRANYTLTPATLVNFDLPPSFIVAGPLAGVVDPPRPLFAGVHYEGAESLRLDGTDDVNIFDVKPSLTTTYHIDGNLPPPGSCQLGGGDYLALDTAGTTGRKLHIQALGQGFWSFTSGHQPVTFESIERFNHVDILAIANARGTPFIDVYDAETREFLYRVQAYESFFRGGVRVATGDVNCDGLPDVVAVPGLNRAATVRAFSGAPNAAGNYTGAQLFEFNAFPPTFKKGAFVAVGDVTGDGANEIIVGADGGWLPRAAVFDGTTLGAAPALLAQFNAFTNSFRGGVRVAAGDLTGDGRAEIIAASGPGTVGTVNVFSGAGFGRIKSLRPLGRSYTRGLFVAAGDLNADGVRDLVATADIGWLPMAAVYSGTKLRGEPRPFLVFANTTRTGVRVAAKPKSGGNPGFVEAVNLVFTTGPNAGSAARQFRHAALTGLLSPRLTRLVFAGAAFDGIYVG